MVVVVEVPVVWEIPPRGGSVSIASGAACFVGFVGLGLVFQDLGDDAFVRLGGDEDFGEDQRARWSGGSFTLVLLDSSRLRLGRSGTWWWW